MKKSLHILLLLALSPALVQSADLTPAQVADRILSGSPAVESARLDAEAASLVALSSVALPDPELEGEYLVGPSGVKNRWGAGISWGIEWPGLYGARKSAAESRGVLAGKERDRAARRALVEIRRNLLDYVEQEKQLEIYSAMQATIDSVKTLSRRAQRGGEITRLDLNKLEIESAAIRARKAETLDRRGITIGNLNVSAGSDCSQLLARMICEFPELPANIAAPDPEKSPELMAAGAEADAARSDIKVVSLESLPGLTVGYRHAFEDGTHFNGVSLGLSLPFLTGRGSRLKKASEATSVAADYRARTMLDEARESVNSEIRRYEILRDNINDLVPLLADDEIAPLLLKAYQGGVITLIEYLNETNYYAEAKVDLVSLRRAAAEAILNISLYSE